MLVSLFPLSQPSLQVARVEAGVEVQVDCFEGQCLDSAAGCGECQLCDLLPSVEDLDQNLVRVRAAKSFFVRV